MKFLSFTKSLDGTNDDFTPFAAPIKQLTIIPNTTTVTVSFLALQDQQFVQLVQGRAITLEAADGSLLEIPRLFLRASSAVTVSLLVGIP